MTPARLEMVYVGARVHKGNTVHAYCRLDNGAMDRATIFEAPLSNHPPGSIISFVSQDGRAVSPEGYLYRGRWDDAEQVQQWGAEHLAIMTAQQAWEDEELPEELEVLAPARRAYRALGTDQRAMFLMHVVRFITEEG